MVRKICSARLELHDEKAGKHLAGRNLIALAVFITDQKLIEHRVRMAGYGLPFHVVEVGDRGQTLARRMSNLVLRNPKSHHDQSGTRCTRDRSSMQGKGIARGIYGLGNVKKVMCTQGNFSPFVLHHSTSFEDDIRFLFEHASSGFAMAAWIDSDLTEAGDAPQYTVLHVTLAEESLVVASGRAHIGLRIADVRKIAMQEGRIDDAFAREERQHAQ